MDLKLLKMLCKDSKQHHVMFHKLDSDSSLLCIAQNVRFEIPYKDLYFETPFLMIFKYYAWASYDFIGPWYPAALLFSGLGSIVLLFGVLFSQQIREDLVRAATSPPV